MQRPTRPRDPVTGQPLLKMKKLATRTGLPSPTILHYVHEGLLTGPTARTGRSMAWYRETSVARLQLIRTLQHDHYLPLAVIKQLLRDGTDPRLLAAASAVSGAVPAPAIPGDRPISGVSAAELAELATAGLIDAQVEPLHAPDGHDAELIGLLAQARSAGLDASVLPVAALVSYKAAVAQLVAFEVALFRSTVLQATPVGELGPTHAAVALSEAFVLHLRRRLLLPALAGDGASAEESTI